jgi:hypothetical protein
MRDDFLKTVLLSEKCLVCFEDTLDRVKCCTAAVCEKCYFKWLAQKRQCMHCKADQCDFDTWVSNYRVEENDSLQPEMQELFNLVLGNEEIIIDIPSPLENILTTIEGYLQNGQIELQVELTTERRQELELFLFRRNMLRLLLLRTFVPHEF